MYYSFLYVYKFQVSHWLVDKSTFSHIDFWASQRKLINTLKEWIQTEQLISEEKNNWESEKATLLDLQDALSVRFLNLK